MEHISRLTTNNVDILLIVSDASRRGILSAARISELADELSISIGKKLFIINQAKKDQYDTLKKISEEYSLELIGIIPDDDKVREFDLKGIPTTELGMESEALKKVYDIFEGYIKS